MRSRATEFFFIVAISAIATEILTPNILDAENLAPHGISTNPESVDLDGSGLPDFWEGLYNAQGIAPSADSDGDGFTNHEESISGTDPFDPYSLLKLQIIEKDATTATVAWIDRPSILESSVDLGVQDPWNSHEEIPYLDDGMRKLDFPIGDFDPKFFRIRNSSEDADSDGVPDWMEALMGFSTTPDSVYQPQSYDTDGDGNDDVSVSGDLAAYNEIYRVPQAGESLTRAQAARLLIQSTFGPGEMSLVDYVASIGAEAWIDEQIAQPASLHQPYIDAIKQDLQAAPPVRVDRSCSFRLLHQSGWRRRPLHRRAELQDSVDASFPCWPGSTAPAGRLGPLTDSCRLPAPAPGFPTSHAPQHTITTISSKTPLETSKTSF